MRARRRVVEQADAAPPARLEGEHAARRGDLEDEVPASIVRSPRSQAKRPRTTASGTPRTRRSSRGRSRALPGGVRRGRVREPSQGSRVRRRSATPGRTAAPAPARDRAPRPTPPRAPPARATAERRRSSRRASRGNHGKAEPRRAVCPRPWYQGLARAAFTK